ncbi:MAG: phage tail protein [Novosphingobium sp.]|jgi:hypothetical protein|nr:phage tail protein [Novosphingobium sp.]
MATLLLSAVGTLIGGPLGGAIGGLIGRGVDSVVFGGGRRDGPRLKELAATTSSYGAALPRHFGRMRVAGSIIWATDLVEHSQTQGGKGGSVRTYSYTASFAVALASRPIAGIGRIWADGNLLRGTAGDLKSAGTLRIHTGTRDQAPDPLIAAREGADRCPAWRGLAYVVFEDLDLGDFFNRIPALTFEVIADEGGFGLQDIVGGVIADADAAVPLADFTGFSCEGPLADALQQLDPLVPIECDAGGARLTIARERLQAAPIALAGAAIAVGDDAFGGASGFARRRAAEPPAPAAILRYYDVARDYQPGLQRAAVRPGPGEPQTLELPAALGAPEARRLIEAAARKARWSRESVVWRSATLDPAIAPGTVVTVPGIAGRWRVTEWEWRESGVELTLARIVPGGADALPATPVDPGRYNPPADLAAPPTLLAAFELPWDGTGSGDTPATFAAASSPGASWSGAALYVDYGGGELHALGPSGRVRSILGTAEAALPPASPLLFDRTSTLSVQLVDPAMALSPASGRQLALGANRALVGAELIQFAGATPLGGGRWRLDRLLRGRGGTEAALAGHAAGERFVLLDDRPVALDPATVGTVPESLIVAVGRGDDTPVSTPIALAGIALRPLSPVHPRATLLADGALALGWTRRARGAWQWRDGVDAPLQEQAERYRITFGPDSAPLAAWTVTEPQLTLPPATLGTLAALLPGGALSVRQQGSHALSLPLHLAMIP